MIERQELAVLLVLAVIGAGFFGYFVTSSPTATVQLSTSQGQATETARSFVQARGVDIGAYRSSTVFSARDESSTFIQRQLSGREEIAALRANNVYFWETRFYKPLEQEYFLVAIDSETGTVEGFRHVLPDEAPGGQLSRSEARERAESFLAAQGHDLEAYELISSSSTERPNRVDHAFTWKHERREVAGAPVYIEVELHGERIGWYDRRINVPDGFTHQYEIQQTRGRLLSFAFLGLSLLLVVGAIVLGLRYYKRGEFDWRLGLTAGGIVAGLTVISSVNSIPQLLHAVPTSIAPWQFLLVSVGGAVFAGVILGGVTMLMTGAGKRLSAAVLGYEVVDSVASIREHPEIRAEVRDQLLAGVLLAGIVLGIYAAFYAVGTRFFDFWLPAQPPQVGAVAMYIPALAALVVAGTAAIWEEVTFRLFAIPATKRYAKYTVVAVVVPAVVWGLGHSGYAVLPFWARAVEVSLIGIVLGWAFLRYGLVATIAAHFTLNAFVTALPMVLAGTPWLVVHGVVSLVIAAVPLLAAGGLTWYGRRASAGA